MNCVQNGTLSIDKRITVTMADGKHDMNSFPGVETVTQYLLPSDKIFEVIQVLDDVCLIYSNRTHKTYEMARKSFDLYYQVLKYNFNEIWNNLNAI